MVYNFFFFVLSDSGFVIKNMFWVFCYGCCNAAYPIVTKMAIRSDVNMTSWVLFFFFPPTFFCYAAYPIVTKMAIRNNDTMPSGFFSSSPPPLFFVMRRILSSLTLPFATMTLCLPGFGLF